MKSDTTGAGAGTGSRLGLYGRLGEPANVEYSRGPARSIQSFSYSCALSLRVDFLLLLALQLLLQAMRDRECERALLRVEVGGFPFPEQLFCRLVEDLADADT